MFSLLLLSLVLLALIACVEPTPFAVSEETHSGIVAAANSDIATREVINATATSSVTEARKMFEEYTGVVPRASNEAATQVARLPMYWPTGVPTYTPAENVYAMYKYDGPEYKYVKACADKAGVPFDTMLEIVQHNHDFFALIRAMAEKEPGFADCVRPHMPTPIK